MGSTGEDRLGVRDWSAMRTDAQRNRERLLEAAGSIFREQGLDVSVGQIAEAAGVGRGTLFRNFPTKDDLIAAIVLERMSEAIADGRALLAGSGDDAELVFTFIADVVGRQQADRALLEGVTDEFLTHPDVRRTHAEVLEVLDALLERGKQAGAIRPEVVPLDVMMLIKGICMTAASLPVDRAEALPRHLELVRAAITTPAYSRPLREPAVSLDDFEDSLDEIERSIDVRS
jgi:AcrR family transcriptional regulator